MYSGSVVVTAYDSESGRRVRILSGGQNTIRLRSLHRAYPSLQPSGIVHWVPELLNIKDVTGICKLIDGCSLALCSATVSVVSAGICHRNEVNSIAWLYRRVQPKYSIHYITLHITLLWKGNWELFTLAYTMIYVCVVNYFVKAPHCVVNPSNTNKIGRTEFPYIHTDGVELAPWFAQAFCYKPRTFSERTENILV